MTNATVPSYNPAPQPSVAVPEKSVIPGFASAERVLSAEDLEHFETQGYVKLARAVPPEQVAAAVDAIWQFLGMDRNDPDDWYRPPHSPNGLVEILSASGVVG